MSPHIAIAKRAAARALWLGKLSEALDIADKLTTELSRDAEHIEAVVALGAQIALLRIEIDALRLGRFDQADEVEPDLIIPAPLLRPPEANRRRRRIPRDKARSAAPASPRSRKIRD